jgi:hypothetical protein
MNNYDLDVIITTNSKNDSFIKMTNNAIMSLRNSIGGDRFKIIIVETNTEAEEYPEANVTVKPNEPYQCNKFYNLGAVHSESDYLLVANNDTVFDPNWWVNIKKAFAENKLDTACLQCTNEQPDIYNRWFKQKHTFKNLDGYDWFFGQAWCVTSEVRDWLFPLDENIHFYFNDDDMVMRFKEKNCKHQLVYKSKMQHLQAKSHEILKEEGRFFEVTWGSKDYFDKKWSK